MSPAIAFIVVTYHPDNESFGKLLDALPKTKTIIVDNGGTLLSDDLGKVTLLSQTANIGFGAGANIGIRHAIAHGASWFVVMNQDLSVTASAIGRLSDMLEKLEPSVAGPFSGGLDPKRWTTILPSETCDYISGSCIAIHEKAVTKAGYFFEPYFMYYEDADYCIRAKRAGIPLTHLDLEGFGHEETKSLGKGSTAHAYYMARNHLLFVSRLAPANVRFREYLRLLKTIFDHMKRHERGALLGVRDFLFGRFGEKRSV